MHEPYSVSDGMRLVDEAGAALPIVNSVAVDGYGHVHVEEVRKALIDAGWRVVRQAGSHEVWAHGDHEARIVVAGKDRDTVPVGTLGSIRRVSGLEYLR
jgi:predicted RNA binding protein YcfA (HicA-like mRNA interferase family)